MAPSPSDGTPYFRKQSNLAQDLLRTAFARLTVLCLTALLSAGILLSCINDLYAFIKPDRSATLVVEHPTELSDLSQRLEELGIIENAPLFYIYVLRSGYADTICRFVGTRELNAAMSYRTLLSELLREEQKSQNT